MDQGDGELESRIERSLLAGIEARSQGRKPRPWLSRAACGWRRMRRMCHMRRVRGDGGAHDQRKNGLPHLAASTQQLVRIAAAQRGLHAIVRGLFEALVHSEDSPRGAEGGVRARAVVKR